jgi:hypothetical protein
LIFGFQKGKIMLTQERLDMVAPCGMDCGICEMHTCEENSPLYDRLIERGIPKESIPCKGCRTIKGMCPVIKEKCKTFMCYSGRNINFCYECDEFPCRKLHPAADRAEILPHNLKIFNLCTIKNSGIEEFLDRSTEIKLRYFKGKIQVGDGPQM